MGDYLIGAYVKMVAECEPKKWWGRWDLNPRPLAPRLGFRGDASAPGSPRAEALWYPVGGIVFPDQAAQRLMAINLF